MRAFGLGWAIGVACASLGVVGRFWGFSADAVDLAGLMISLVSIVVGALCIVIPERRP